MNGGNMMALIDMTSLVVSSDLSLSWKKVKALCFYTLCLGLNHAIVIASVRSFVLFDLPTGELSSLYPKNIIMAVVSTCTVSYKIKHYHLYHSNTPHGTKRPSQYEPRFTYPTLRSRRQRHRNQPHNSK